MTSAPLTLYMDDLYLSPYTYSVQAALLEKGVAFTVHETSFAGGRSTDPAFRGRTFTDLIPALAHHEPHGEPNEELVLSESLAILEYLEERFGPPDYPGLYPDGIENRARARALLSWYRTGFTALRQERSTETVFYADQRARQPLSAAAREEVADWLPALRAWRRPGGPFLFGTAWSVVDAETALMLQRLIKNGDPLEPELVDYANMIWARPSAAAFVNHPRRPYRSYYA